MNKTETADMMAFISGFDHRNVGFTETEAWYIAMGDVPWDDTTKRAIAEFYSTPGGGDDRFIQPHHVRTGRARIRADRLDRLTEPVPNDIDGVDYVDELRAVRRAIADGYIATAQDAERYMEWGGSMYLAYRRGTPGIGDPVNPQSLRARPVAALLADAFPLRPTRGGDE